VFALSLRLFVGTLAVTHSERLGLFVLMIHAYNINLLSYHRIKISYASYDK